MSIFDDLLSIMRAVSRYIEQGEERKSQLLSDEISKMETISKLREIEVGSFEALESYNDFLCSLCDGRLIIDTNIIMDKEYDSFIEIVSEFMFLNKRKIRLYKVQFDELVNIKDKSLDKSSMARHGLRTIERLMEQDVLEVDDLSAETDRNAYFDAFLLSEISKALEVCSVITNDIELRIKLSQINKNKELRHNILDGDSVIERTKNYCLSKMFLDQYKDIISEEALSENNQMNHPLMMRKHWEKYLPILTNCNIMSRA